MLSYLHLYLTLGKLGLDVCSDPHNLTNWLVISYGLIVVWVLNPGELLYCWPSFLLSYWERVFSTWPFPPDNGTTYASYTMLFQNKFDILV